MRAIWRAVREVGLSLCCGDVERYLSKRNRWIALSGEEVEDVEEVKVKEMYEQGEDAN